MSGDNDAAGGGLPDPGAVRQPLPPEVPMPRPEIQPESAAEPVPEPDDAAPDGEWWRRPAPPDPEIPAPRTEPGPDTPAGGDGLADPGTPQQQPGDGGPDPDWWRKDGDDGRSWAAHGQDGIVAATEIGAYIGDAIASRLPDPYAPGRPRLDLRWLRLKYNLPALFIALLVTWGGRSSVDRMADMVAEDGLFAPLGVVLLFALLVPLLMVLPIGGVLASALSHLVSWLVQGLVRLLGRAWSLPYIGYLLRLAVAVAIWSFAIAVVRVIWRGVVHFLTGA